MCINLWKKETKKFRIDQYIDNILHQTTKEIVEKELQSMFM